MITNPKFNTKMVLRYDQNKRKWISLGHRPIRPGIKYVWIDQLKAWWGYKTPSEL